jgi:PAS domain S-box-containing protein
MENSFHRMQDMLQHKRKSAADLMQFTPFGYMWVRLNSEKLVLSHTIYSMLEKEPFSEFFTVQSWRSFVHPQDLYKLLQAEEELLSTGLSTTAEYRLITQSGRHIYVDHHMYLSGSTNTERKIMSIVHDVTEQKSAEVILETMNECFFQLDKNFAFRRINERAIKFWKLEDAHTIGKTVASIFPQIRRTAFHNVLLRAHAEKINIAQDIVDPVTGHWLHLSVTPYADDLVVIFYDIQNEKEAEQRLQESENHYHSLIENIPDVIIRWDKGLKVVFANTAFEKRMGATHGTFFGRTVHELDQPDAIAIPLIDSLQQVFDTGQPVDHYTQLAVQKGEAYFLFRMVPEKNKKGEVATVLSIARDVTEIKRSERHLEEEHRRLKEAQAVGHVGSFEWDASLDKITWSDEMYRILGLTLGEEISLKKIFTMIHPHDLADAKKKITTCRKSTCGVSIIHRLLRSDGEIRIVTSYLQSFADDEGNITHITGTVLDITELKQTEERLREKSHYLQHIQETVPDMISLSNLDTNEFDYLNREAFKAQGFDPDWLNARSAEERSEIIHVQDREALAKYFQQIRTAGDEDVVTAEYRARDSNGQWKWFLVRGRIFQRDDKGRATHVVNVIQNITEEKTLNSELKNFTTIAADNYSETLRHLYISLEMVVKNDAHNLSNSGKANLRRAQGAIQKMKLLSDDIGKYLQLYDKGIEKALIDPNILLQELVSKLERKISEANATIEIGDLPVLPVDRLLFSPLLLNLIDNSIKYRDLSRPLSIQIKSSRADELNEFWQAKKNSPYIIISVSDNGVGFKQEESEKVFELFSKLNDSSQYKGSGIGLAICKKIMEMHGGFITAAGRPGEGASFYCYFPHDD